MIKKSLLFLVVLLLIYSVYIAQKPINYGVSQHQWQDNVIKAQNLIFSKDTVSSIIVGSSLSTRLSSDSITYTYNLSFGGLSLFDGLSLIKHHHIKPKYIFIETNLLMRKADQTFLKGLNNQFLYYLRKENISLRENKQPLAILSSHISIILGNILPQKNTTIKAEDKKVALNKLLEIHKKNYAIAVEDQAINNQIAELKKIITELEKNDIQFIFFEMPTHKIIESSYLAKKVRINILNAFSNYPFIPILPNLKLRTTDGLHLRPDDARLYSSLLNKEFKKHVYSRNN